MSTLRIRFIDLVSEIRDAFPETPVAYRARMMVDAATSPDRPVSRWAKHSNRGAVPATWNTDIAITDLRNTISLAHREGYIDNDDFTAFEEVILDYRDETRQERVVDAMTELQKALRRQARINRKG